MDSQLFANAGSMVESLLLSSLSTPNCPVRPGETNTNCLAYTNRLAAGKPNTTECTKPGFTRSSVSAPKKNGEMDHLLKKNCWRWKLHVILATAASDLAKTTIFQPFCFPLLTRLRADRPKRGLASPKKWHLECQWVTPWGAHLQLVLPDISHFLMVCTLCRQRSWLNSGGRMFRSQN